MAGVIENLMSMPNAQRAEGDWQHVEVKQLKDILARQRDKLRAAVAEYRHHKCVHLAETDPIEKLYLGYEGIFMRDHLRDALRLYVMVNRDYHQAYRLYLDGMDGAARSAA